MNCQDDQEQSLRAYDQCACAGRILIATSYFRECGSRSGEAVRRPGKEGEGPEYGEGLL